MTAAWNGISAESGATRRALRNVAAAARRKPADRTGFVCYYLNMYTCDVCGANTKTRQGLAGHYRFRHEGVGYASNYRPRQHPLDRKVDELAGTLKSTSETVERLELQSTALELLVLRIADRLGMDVRADIATASLKGTLRVLRKDLTE